MAKLPKQPVIVILGHVDHGKTSLVDYIRKTHLADKEVGGITQNISAYEVEHGNERLTFLDTPGHEAFTALRERGAHIADIAILLVAADEGVQPQTKEALAFIQREKIPFVVAISKVDKPQARPDRVKQDIFNLGVGVEGFGGTVPCVNISAKTGQGVDDLLGLLVLLRDMHDITYDPAATPSGFILESAKDTRKGISVFLIGQNGTLRTGDHLRSERSQVAAKVKRMERADGTTIDAVLPAVPVVVFGFERLPSGGERWTIADSDFAAAAEKMAAPEVLGKKPDLAVNYIIRAADSGGMEALLKLLGDMSREHDATFRILNRDLGQLALKDVQDAREWDAVLMSFGLKTPKAVQQEIAVNAQTLLEDDLIFKLKEKMEEFLKRGGGAKERPIRVQVLKVFSQKSSRVTLGARVAEGTLETGKRFVLIRDEKKVAGGKVVSIEKDKKSAQRVPEGEVCAFVLEGNNLNLVQEGDELASALS